MSDGDAVIEVVRPADGAWPIRRFIIKMNGEVVARLWRGESERMAVPPGRYKLQARMELMRSQPVELDLVSGESAEVVFDARWDVWWRTWLTPKKALTAKRTNRH